jgi:hypothetical protein
MPTNKLWIEHTEHAAWESVSALRAELAEEKKRLLLVEGRLSLAEEKLARATQTRSSKPSEMPASDAPTVDESSDFLIVARRFVRAMQKRYAAIAGEPIPVGIDERLARLASKVEELLEMDEIELADAAVDVAVLALCLHEGARASR